MPMSLSAQRAANRPCTASWRPSRHFGHNFRHDPPSPPFLPAGRAACAATPSRATWCASTRSPSHDLIYPVFVQEGEKRRDAVASMPGVERLSLDLLLPVAEQCVALGIPVMALFPVIDAGLKTPAGDEAFNPDGLIPRVVARAEVALSRTGRDDRRGARPLHQPRPGRPARRHRLHPQRPDRRSAGQAGADASRRPAWTSWRPAT